MPIDPEILRSMKVYQNIGYAPNTNKQKRNVIPYDLSDKNNKDGKSGVPESPIGRGKFSWWGFYLYRCGKDCLRILQLYFVQTFSVGHT